MASSRVDGGQVRQPPHEDLVVGDQPIELGDDRLEVIEEAQHLVPPGVGQIPADAAHPVIVVGEPRAAQLLEQVVHVLALAQGVRERRHRAEIHGHRAERDAVGRDAVQLVADDAQVVRARRHRQPAQLLDGGGPGMVGRHRADVVDAIGVGHEALVGALLGDVLDGPVQVAHVGLGAGHDLAVGAHDEADHPVGRRVLRPHVEDHLVAGLRSRAGEDQLAHAGSFSGRCARS